MWCSGAQDAEEAVLISHNGKQCLTTGAHLNYVWITNHLVVINKYLIMKFQSVWLGDAKYYQDGKNQPRQMLWFPYSSETSRSNAYHIIVCYRQTPNSSFTLFPEDSSSYIQSHEINWTLVHYFWIYSAWILSGTFLFGFQGKNLLFNLLM